LNLTNQNIEQLIELCKQDNQHAQMEVYNRYYKAMYNTAFIILKNSYEAEDVMQDSFLTAFTKLNGLKEISTLNGRRYNIDPIDCPESRRIQPGVPGGGGVPGEPTMACRSSGNVSSTVRHGRSSQRMLQV
jgi:hypothetical protein